MRWKQHKHSLVEHECDISDMTQETEYILTNYF